MTGARVVAASAAIVTGLLVQATVVAPATAPSAAQISLPAVLVALVALVDGPGAGMSFGFAAGLVADLGSHHAAGVLALCWLGVGLTCGCAATSTVARATQRRLRGHRLGVRDAMAAGLVCAAAAMAATLLSAATRGGGDALDAITHLAPTALGDLVLALLAGPLVRGMLRANSLRAPVPVVPIVVSGSIDEAAGARDVLSADRG